MKKTHDILKNKAKWYRDWDGYRFSSHVHWALLGIFVLGIAFGFSLQLWLMPPEFSEASTSTEVELDDNRYGSQCYGGRGDYYTDIPSSYSGSKVSVEAAGTYNPSSCADLSVDLCDWDSSCDVDVVPGQRLNFEVSWYCGYCGDYESEDWTISVSSVAGPVCGNGSCESGETCSSCVRDCLDTGEVCCSGTAYTGDCCSDSDCYANEECSSHTCVSAAAVCGDGICETSEEDCLSCSLDCGCFSTECCSPLSWNSDTLGCVDSGVGTTYGKLCCSGTDYTGDCCDDFDCSSGQACESHQCADSGPCGDGTCASDEDCSTCLVDCPCAGGACCFPDALSYTTSHGCALDGGIISSSKICCSGTDYTGDCCDHNDCDTGQSCTSHGCVATGPSCGDGSCDWPSEHCSSCSADCGACTKGNASSSMTFTSSGGTQDGGYITFLDGTHTWTVTLPDNFSKVEVTNYDKHTPSTIKKYMGWNGYVKVNGEYLWKFKSWSASTGGLIQDYALGQQVKETTGHGYWIDATEFFNAGTNTVAYYHYTEGDGMGLKIDVTPSSVPPPSSTCGDGTCSSDETCTSCASDCLSSTQVCCSSTVYTGDCCSVNDCTIDETCTSHTCVSTGPTCGDGACDYTETSESCSSCPADCPCTSSECCSTRSSAADYYGCVDSERVTTSGYLCCSGAEYSGDCCSDSDCTGDEVCTSHTCVALSSTCGDGTCDSDEDCSTCILDCYCYDTECCAPSASDADSYGCVDTGEATASGKICCSGTDYTGDCCSDTVCGTGEACASHSCLSTGPTCGDGACETGETCTSCASDCLSSTQVCCSGTAYTGDCCIDGDCGDHEECSSHVCIAVPYCGDGACETGETCTSCKEDCGPCVAAKSKEPKEKKDLSTGSGSDEKEKSFKISYATQKLIDEYKALHARVIDLNEKIVVAELGDLELTPFKMHSSIEASIDELVESEETEVQLTSLLKHAIAAEELALATYEGEAEMAGMLAESSWQALKAYLLYKVEAMVSSQLEGLDLSEATELASSMKASFDNSADPEEYLKEMGLEDISEINQAIHEAVNSSGGKVSKYLESVENQVRQAYIDAYVEMFNSNFKYAIAKQLVYYQVAVKYWIIDKGTIPNADMPYGEYRSAMAAIQNEIRQEKEFIAGDNVFARLINLNNTFKKGADEVDKILEEIGSAASAVDKGASLAQQETNFSEVVDDLKEYNASLKQTIDLAAQTLEPIGKFAESVYGTYKEAELYSIFFNAYDKWYDNSLGGAVTVLEVPMTNTKIDISIVYDNLAPLVGVADQALTKAGEAANYVVGGAEKIAGAGVEMLKGVGNKVQATVEGGKKLTHKFAVKTAETVEAVGEVAAETAEAVGEAATDVAEGISEKTGELVAYGENLIYSIEWPSWVYQPQEKGLAILPLVHAQGGNKIELALISPSGVRFPGREHEDGSGMYVVVNNPEPGEWEAEIIGKEVEGEQPIEITTTVAQADLQESNFEKVEIPKKEREVKSPFWKEYLWWIVGGGLVILVGIVIGLILLKKKLKSL